MTDLTPTLSAILVQEHSSRPLRSVDKPDRPLSQSLDAFLHEATQINRSLTSLLGYLRNIRQPYVSAAPPPRRRALSRPQQPLSPLGSDVPTHLDDDQREEIDRQTSSVLSDINGNITNLASAVSLQYDTAQKIVEQKYGKPSGLLWKWAAGDGDTPDAGKSEEQLEDEGRAKTTRGFRDGVLWYLNKKLERAVRMQQEMVQARLGRERQRQMSVLYDKSNRHVRLPSDGTLIGGGDGTRDLRAHDTWPELDPEEVQLSPEQMQLFEEENRGLLEHVNDQLARVTQAEKSMVEISSLQQTLANQLSVQGDAINQLVEDASKTDENVRRGNRELQRATARSSTAKGVFWATTALKFSDALGSSLAGHVTPRASVYAVGRIGPWRREIENESYSVLPNPVRRDYRTNEPCLLLSDALSPNAKRQSRSFFLPYSASASRTLPTMAPPQHPSSLSSSSFGPSASSVSAPASISVSSSQNTTAARLSQLRQHTMGSNDSAIAATLFTAEAVPQAPEDPLFGLMAAYRADTSDKKVDLGIGAYRDDNAKPWVLPVVRKADEILHNDPNFNHEYLPIAGLSDFTSAAQKVILGADSPALKEGRVSAAQPIQRGKEWSDSALQVASLQTISGTGAVHLGGLFLAKFLPKPTPAIYVSNPTWANHNQIFANVHLTVKNYPYFSAKTKGLDFDGLIATLDAAPAGSVVLLHACAHNPTGVDPSRDQWVKIAQVLRQRQLFPFFDCAYQGFASGDLAQDNFAIRYFVEQGFELVIAQSFAKNFGLYGQRAGAFHYVASPSPSAAETVKRVASQLAILQRSEISNPPIYGAKIASIVLNDPQLFKEWEQDLRTMSGRILDMRKGLKAELDRLGTPGNWDHIVNQIGMFSFTGLTEAQVLAIRSKWHVYMTKNGRISMAGLNTRNLKYFAEAVDDVMAGVNPYLSWAAVLDCGDIPITAFDNALALHQMSAAYLELNSR
ncbi:hypothetical protein DV738_g2243, partial [Chaetothyriales sp. CBS 135597]